MRSTTASPVHQVLLPRRLLGQLTAAMLINRLGDWLSSPAAQVLAFVPGQARRTSGERAGNLPLQLRPWRRAATIWRFLVVLRRWAIVAAIVGVLGVIIHRPLPDFSLWIALGIALVVLLVGSAINARAVPSFETVAQLLDRDLVLQEQVSSALEAGDSPLAPQLQTRAESLVVQAQRTWRLRAARNAWEWTVLGLAVVLLALLAALPVPHSSLATRSSRPVALAPPPAHLPRIHVSVATVAAPRSSPPAVHSPNAAQHLKPGIKPRGIVPHSVAKSRKKRAAGGAPGVPQPPASIYTHGGHAPRTRHGQQVQGHPVLHHGNATSPGPQTRRGGTPLGANGSGNHGNNTGGNQVRGTASGQAGSGKAGKSSGRSRLTGKARSNPYGTHHGIPRSVTNPGLVTGPALNSSTHAPGNAAGRGRGGSKGKSAAHAATRNKGSQFRLKSPYAGAGTGKQRTTAGKSGQQGNKTAHERGGPSGTGTTVYIPLAPNTPPPAESSIIARYFGSGRP